MKTLHALIVAAALTEAVFAAACTTAAAASSGGYVLGAEDRIRVKVLEWRVGISEAYEWKALAGEYTVSANGTVAVPLLGAVAASGRTPDQLAADIEDRLWRKIGLANKPEASVEIAQYRPFYILGAVEKPGGYDYSPSMSVIQAVSRAGGFVRRTDEPDRYERESIGYRGELNGLLAERARLLVHQARLEAELQNLSTIVLPPEFVRQGGRPETQGAVENEQSLLETRENGLRSQLASLQQTQTLLGQQILSMTTKSATLARQAQLAQAELSNVKTLVSRGDMVSSRQLELEQNAAQYTSAQLDLDIAVLRAKQDISQAEREMQDLQDQRKSQNLADLNEARSKLVQNRERVETLRDLIYNADVTMPEADLRQSQNDKRAASYAVIRHVGLETRSLELRENDAVEPGDTIRVVLPRPIFTSDAAPFRDSAQ